MIGVGVSLTKSALPMRRRALAGSVARLFSNGEPGAVFIAQKPSAWGGNNNLCTMYQDAAGTTPVTALEQTIGLQLDVRPIFLGPELVANGRFGTDTSGWTAVGGATIAAVGGELQVTNTANGAAEQAEYSFPFVVGKTYQVAGQQRKGTGAFAQALVETNAANLFTSTTGSAAAVLFSAQFTVPAGTTALVFRARSTGSTGTALFDNISIREVIAAPNVVGQPLRGSELMNSATSFSSSANWSLNAGITIAGGVLSYAAAAANLSAFYSGGAVAQRFVLANSSYEYVINITALSAGALQVLAEGGVAGSPIFTAPGVYRGIFRATADGQIYIFTKNATTTATVASFSLKLVHGNHRSQSTGSAQAKLSARYNKVTARNANPTDLTNLTKSGDAASVLSVVNDSAALAAAGLSGVCTLGNVYKLDNSAGISTAFANIAGATGNTNSHVLSCYVRGGLGALGGIAAGPNGFSANANYTKASFTNTSTSTTNTLFVQANPGAVVYFILPDLREACYAYLPTPQVITGTGTTASDYNDSGFPARIVYSGAQGYATGSVDFGGGTAAQNWWGGASLGTSAGICVELTSSTATTDGGFNTFVDNSHHHALRSTVAQEQVDGSNTLLAPWASVITALQDTSLGTQQARTVVRRSGASDQGASAVGPTTAGGTLANAVLNYGFRGGSTATNPLTGDEFVSIVRGGPAPATSAILAAERFCASKLRLPLSV